MTIDIQDAIEARKVVTTRPSKNVTKAMVTARAGLGLLAEFGVTRDQLREAVFNGFRSPEEAEADGFDMADSSQCILGRAVGDYCRGAELLGLTQPGQSGAEDNQASVAHGFLVLGEEDDGYNSYYDYSYAELAEAWERVLIPEWFAVPQFKTLQVVLDLSVPEAWDNSETAYSVRDTVEQNGIDRDGDQSNFRTVRLYTWDIVEDD